MTTTTTLPLDGERLLQIARDTGLRHHLHAVDPTAAGELLTRFAEAVINARYPAMLDAIDGALAYGARSIKPPPAGHWLNRFWDIGREWAAVRDQALDEAATACEEHPDGMHFGGGAFVTCAQAIRALKGTPAAAIPQDVDDTNVVDMPAAAVPESVCKGSMALGSGCGECARCLAEIEEAAAGECDKPPFGWRCTRTHGHDGPCAAVEAPNDVAVVARCMDRLRKAARVGHSTPAAAVAEDCSAVEDTMVATWTDPTIKYEDSVADAQPVAWRHSATHNLYEQESDVPLADGDESAQPLFLHAQPSSNPGPLAAVEPTDTQRVQFLIDTCATYTSVKVPLQLIVQENHPVHRLLPAKGYRVAVRAAIDAAIAASKEGAAS